ncbi:MAG TPA: PASTA domain-containing protein, partial [Solirubrobacteraceae bacterium]|nr:PASTA domain-containing protein [Solirubrobacteraceae bacterium]
AAAGAAAGAGAAIAGSHVRADPATNGSGEMAAVPVEEPRQRSWAPWGWAALVLVLIAGAAAAAYLLTRPQQNKVPRVIGDQYATARTVLIGAHFQVDRVLQPSSKAKGVVIGEQPPAGTTADQGSTVTLEVSGGPGDVSVPSVQGLTVAAATQHLKRVHLRVNNVVPRPSTQFPAGQVTATNPGVAKPVPTGTAVTLFVSSGAPQTSVPGVVGDTQTAATAQLTKAGFNVNQKNQPSSSVAVGNVISQSPAAGTNVAKGATVTITVATAPATVTVPSVTGDPAAGAVNALTAAGFNVVQTSQEVASSDMNGIVTHQSPRGNSTAKKGATVTITVGHYTQSTSSSTTTSTTTQSSSSTTPTTTSSSSASPAP